MTKTPKPGRSLTEDVLSAPGALSHLDEDGEEDYGDDGGEEEGLHGVVGQQEAQGVGDGPPQPAVRHDELVLLRQLDDAEFVNDVCEANHPWNTEDAVRVKKTVTMNSFRKKYKKELTQKMSLINKNFSVFLCLRLLLSKP